MFYLESGYFFFEPGGFEFFDRSFDIVNFKETTVLRRIAAIFSHAYLNAIPLENRRRNGEFILDATRNCITVS